MVSHPNEDPFSAVDIETYSMLSRKPSGLYKATYLAAVAHLVGILPMYQLSSRAFASSV